MKPSNIQESAGTQGKESLPNHAGLNVSLSPSQKRLLQGFLIFVGLLAILFLGTLSDLVRFSLARERNSYLILVPLISGYLIWIKRLELFAGWRSSFGPASILGSLGFSAFLLSRGVGGLHVDYHFSLKVLAFFLMLVAGSFAFFGREAISRITFPCAFLIFGVPMPGPFAEGIEIFLQHASAEAAYWMLSMTGMTLFRNGLEFQMPGIAIKVAQECSGYNSSFVLFMLSTLAGYMFLQSPGRRWALVAAVIPLAILRNGFRITTISLLSVHLDPSWIDSPLHHRGGPVFFALSMIPFLAFLWWLRKRDISVLPTTNQAAR